MKKYAKVSGILFVLIGAVLVLRFVLGGNEDTWICQDGAWIKHGNPSQPQPVIPCEKDGQTIDELTPAGEYKKVSFEESQKIAQDFASGTSTYKFDGQNLKLDFSAALECPYCWEFTFSYASRQGGYGDRTGKILTQVITPHKLLVTVQEGKVIAAVVDGTYDELNNRFVK